MYISVALAITGVAKVTYQGHVGIRVLRSHVVVEFFKRIHVRVYSVFSVELQDVRLHTIIFRSLTVKIDAYSSWKSRRLDKKQEKCLKVLFLY